MKTRHILKFITFVCLLTLTVACGNSSQKDTHYAGTFVDEFGNQFILNDDHTGTIQFYGNTKVNKIAWKEHKQKDRQYATIEFNGDPSYYFLHNGYLFRQQSDMEKLHCPIAIEYDN